MVHMVNARVFKRRFVPICTTVGAIWLAYSRHCASIRTQVQQNFFLLYGPPNQWRDPGLYLQVPKTSPHMAPTSKGEPFSGRQGLAEELQFLGDLQTPGTFGPGFGDCLVTTNLPLIVITHQNNITHA